MQEASEFGSKDMALLFGGVAFVIAVLMIGIGGGSKRHGWLFYLGLVGLIVSFGAIGYGSLLRGNNQASS